MCVDVGVVFINAFIYVSGYLGVCMCCICKRACMYKYVCENRKYGHSNRTGICGVDTIDYPLSLNLCLFFLPLSSYSSTHPTCLPSFYRFHLLYLSCSHSSHYFFYETPPSVFLPPPSSRPRWPGGHENELAPSFVHTSQNLSDVEYELIDESRS